MGTLENTISMMEVLPEADLIEIQNFTKKLLRRHESMMNGDVVGKVLKPMSHEDFMKDVENAEQEIVCGKCRSAEEVWGDLEHRYGL